MFSFEKDDYKVLPKDSDGSQIGLSNKNQNVAATVNKATTKKTTTRKKTTTKKKTTTTKRTTKRTTKPTTKWTTRPSTTQSKITSTLTSSSSFNDSCQFAGLNCPGKNCLIKPKHFKQN
jgi:hypothetical protein